MKRPGLLPAFCSFEPTKNATTADFFGAGGLAFLQGFFAKTWCKLWCFDGQFVVLCVVNVVR
jgi:hypothetical protein